MPPMAPKPTCHDQTTFIKKKMREKGGGGTNLKTGSHHAQRLTTDIVRLPRERSRDLLIIRMRSRLCWRNSHWHSRLQDP